MVVRKNYLSNNMCGKYSWFIALQIRGKIAGGSAICDFWKFICAKHHWYCPIKWSVSLKSMMRFVLVFPHSPRLKHWQKEIISNFPNTDIKESVFSPILYWCSQRYRWRNRLYYKYIRLMRPFHQPWWQQMCGLHRDNLRYGQSRCLNSDRFFHISDNSKIWVDFSVKK